MVGMTKRQHGLDALARRHHIVGDTEADGVAEEMAHRASWRIDWRLVSPRRVEPGAMRAGDVAFEIGDGGDHRCPGLGRAAGLRTVVAARVESQRREIVEISDMAMAQVELDKCAGDRLRDRKQPAN